MTSLTPMFFAALLLVPGAAGPIEGPEREGPPERWLLLPLDALLARGGKLLDQADHGSVDLAAEMYKWALEADPNSAAAYAGSSRVSIVRFIRRWEEDDAAADRAVDQARRAVSLSAGDPRGHAALALALLVSGEDAPSFDEADRAWALRGEDPEPWVVEAYAQSLVARGDLDEALGVVTQELPGRGDRIQLHYLAGNTHLEMGRNEEAILSYRRALLLDHDYAPAILQLAYAFERFGNIEAASRLYADVLRRFPEQTGLVYARMSASLIARGKFSEALPGLDKAIFKTRRGLGQGTVVYMKAQCFEALKQTERARTLYRQVIGEFPKATLGSFGGGNLAVSSYEALARIELAANNQAEAVRLMEQAMEMDRPTLSLFMGLARLYSDYGLFGEAARILKRGSEVDFGPRQSGAKIALYVAWARALRAQGTGGPQQPAEALSALDRDAAALDARGDIVHLLEAARACAILGSPSKGIGWIRRAVERGYQHLDWVANDEEMAPLTRDPGFAALRKTLQGS